ncbi:MAG: hypothetical protein HOP20_11180 [Sulfuriferula sp.]|nr:hypothetical protein [Sulfuriferula sp.]
MSIAEQIYEVAKPLPESMALEVLHFVEYLRSRNVQFSEVSGWNQAQSTVMAHVWENEDDEVWNDVKKL